MAGQRQAVPKYKRSELIGFPRYTSMNSLARSRPEDNHLYDTATNYKISAHRRTKLGQLNEGTVYGGQTTTVRDLSSPSLGLQSQEFECAHNRGNHGYLVTD